MVATTIPTFGTGTRVRSVPRSWTVASDRPLLRGRFHQLGAVLSVPAGVHAVATAGAAARPAVAVYAATWTAMFTASALLHRVRCSPDGARRLRKADHVGIFVHIGGAATALCLLALPVLVGTLLLVGVWSGVAAGVVTKLRRLTGDSAHGSRLYLPLAWSLVVAVPLMVPALGARGVVLLGLSALAYTAGARCYFRRRPDPVPTVFGFHEVWHVATLVGGVAFHGVVLHLATV